MKKIRSIVTLILLVLLVKGTVFVIVKYNQNKDERLKATDHNASLKEFLLANVVNTKGIQYPIQVTPHLLMTGRSILTEDENIYVVDHFKTDFRNAAQLKTTAAYNQMHSDLIEAHCSSLQEKELIWRGWSDVGNIQEIADINDEVVSVLRVTKADCISPKNAR